MPLGENGTGEVIQVTGRQDEELRGRAPFGAGGRKGRKESTLFAECPYLLKLVADLEVMTLGEILCITCTRVTHALVLTQLYTQKNFCCRKLHLVSHF